MTERQQAVWQRIRTHGKAVFVVIAALLWFTVFGFLPLSLVMAHDIVLQVLPVLLGTALLSGLLVGDVAWHFLECAYLEHLGCASTSFLARRRQTLSWFLAAPCVVPLLSVLIGIALPSPIGIVVGELAVLVLLIGALAALERTMRRTG